ncbi:MAG: hypothetical protein WD733_26610 [Bryobacterales bacterium]
MNIAKWDQSGKYAEQSEIVAQALAASDHSLDELLRLMREKGLASVYLSGSRLDNDYCFGSTDVGLLFSVLPEDQHAAVPGYHPGSTEVYVTFQGSLVMECLEDGRVVAKTADPDHVLILPPGQCHRVRRDGRRKAASAIVKTNLRHKPSVMRCDNCSYYTDKTACLLYQSWSTEASSEAATG